MFIRRTSTHSKKTNTTYTKHQLVESFRSENGPRQRVIMELGALTLPKSEWRRLAAVLESRLAGQESLFAEDPVIVEAANAAMKHYTFVQTKSLEKQQRHEERDLVTVDMNSITSSEYRSLGPELVAHTLWNRLKLDDLLHDCGFSLHEQALAQAVVVGRLVAPSSDLATWQWLRQQTALLELLPADCATIDKNAIYEIADRLLAHKDKLEAALRNQESLLFPNQTTLFLYDLTNTYFEGQGKNNELAKRGKSKEKRADCPLVTLALVVDQRGFPIISRMYGGNQSEPQTLPEILKHLYVPGEPDLFAHEQPTIVMDRGIATKDNIALLKAGGYPYLVVERRAVEKDYVQEFEQAKETFEPIGSEITPGTVYVKKLPWEDGTRVLCLNAGREHKEQAMDVLKEERFLQDLGRLGIRPVYHQHKSRTEGHLFISVLAYHLLICIEKTMRDENDTRNWSTLRKTLSTHQRSTIILTDDKDQIHHIRIFA